MKTANCTIALLLCAFNLFTSFTTFHPIKLTASLIEYTPESKRLKMMCRVFIDDFENSLNAKLTKDINIYEPSPKDEQIIENYFKKNYSIYINGQKYPIRYQGSVVSEANNIVTIAFAEHVMPIRKGDEICIENTLLFEEFGFLQSNVITLNIPPLKVDENFEARHDDYTIAIQL